MVLWFVGIVWYMVYVMCMCDMWYMIYVIYVCVRFMSEIHE
jgi:hypothetical protein